MNGSEFNSIVVTEYQFLLNQAFKISRDTETAEDLVQDTLLKAFKNKENFILGTNIRGWLYTILRNSFINLYRKSKRQNTFLDDTENQYYLNQESPDAQELDHDVNVEYIYKVIGALDDNLRKPFIKYFEGYKYDEIAEELVLPLGTVKSRIFKARKIMQAQLTDFR